MFVFVYTTRQTVMPDKTYHARVTSIKDLTPRPLRVQNPKRTKYGSAVSLNSCSPDQELCALTKELASWLRLSGSLQVMVHVAFSAMHQLRKQIS